MWDKRKNISMKVLALVLTLAVVVADMFHIDTDLTYTTTTTCDKITKNLPKQYELAGLLLPNDEFDGEISLTKNALDHTTCMLHLRSEGDIVPGISSVKNVFDVAKGMDTKLKELVVTQYLRRAEERLQELKLMKIRFQLNHRMYTMNLEPDIGTPESQRGEVTIDDGDVCSKLSSEDIVHGIGIMEEMEIKRLVHEKEPNAAQCVVGLNVVTFVPSFASIDGAFAFLETIDNHVQDYFGLDANEEGGKREVLLSSVSMQFFTKASSQSASALASNLSTQSINPPTKEIMMGIMMGVVLLGMMLMGMTYQKKRHEQHCQERHHKASRIAQIQRISYRMGYGRVPVEEEEEEEEIL